jgi:phospholipid-binding lipoprotein MlaA
MIHAGNVGSAVRTAQIPAGAVTFRANNFAAINDVKYNSIDPYARTRSLYFQSRAGELGSDQDKNKTPRLADDQFDAFFDETIQ